MKGWGGEFKKVEEKRIGMSQEKRTELRCIQMLQATWCSEIGSKITGSQAPPVTSEKRSLHHAVGKTMRFVCALGASKAV